MLDNKLFPVIVRCSYVEIERREDFKSIHYEQLLLELVLKK